MQSRLNPYLSFRDNAREAMEFYRTVFGGTLDVNTFAEFGASEDPSEDDKVMHSVMEADNGIMFMAADTPNSMEHRPGTTMSMSLSGDDDAELLGYFEKLSDGGTVTQPLEAAPWGDKFGMVTDRFGIDWMVNIAGQST
ncbi:MAG TPA: VOC family protein [Euzebyales bacterium]|nr:VOC family protein [Euzebyales bacterium]